MILKETPFLLNLVINHGSLILKLSKRAVDTSSLEL
jgi:hypothetical protein